MSKNNNLELFPDFQSESKQHRPNKGKTWEEIYGIEEADRRRKRAKEVKRVSSTKGRKWEEIYTPEEVARRRERMKNNNPYHTLTEAQKAAREIKNSASHIEYFKNNTNPMLGKNHTEETKAKISKTRKGLFKSPDFMKQFKTIMQLKKDAYFEKNYIVFNCKCCDKEMRVLPKDYHRSKIKGTHKEFCSKVCQTEYFLTNDHFKYKANGWETYIINLNIDSIKFTGNHIFWITMRDDNNNSFYKNPDFIVMPFSTTKKVIEVWGKRWHTENEMLNIKMKYAELGIDCLLLTNDDFTPKNKCNIKNKIERWLTNVQ